MISISRAQLLWILLAILVFISAAAQAQTARYEVELTVVLPTERESGAEGEPRTPLARDEIATTSIYRAGELLLATEGAAERVVVELPSCSASGLTATVTDTAGLESAHSDDLTVNVCRPMPPRISGFRTPPASP